MKTTKNKYVVLSLGLAAGFFLAGRSLWAAGYEFEGVGARQAGRAGAAIADADDWTAIYWNPGNIAAAAQHSREFGVEIFGGEAFAHDPNSLSKLPAGPFPKTDLHSNFILGAIGGIVPIGEKGGIGFGFYTPLLQGAKFQSVANNANQTAIDLDNSAAILTWNVSGSYRFTDRFSAGAGLNVLYGRFTSDIDLFNYFVPTDHLNNSLDGNGIGLEGIFGVRGELSDKWSVGAVYRTGSDIDIKGDASADYTLTFTQHSTFHYDLRHPPTYGIGAAFRPTGRWTLTTDYDRTVWHRFVSNIRYDTPQTFLPNLPNTFDWSDTWKLRFGSRLKVSSKSEWLAGYSYDVPALDEPSVDFSTSIDVFMQRFSTGFAHAWNERVETILSVLAGYGERHIADQTYHLSGYQIMLETRFGPAVAKSAPAL